MSHHNNKSGIMYMYCQIDKLDFKSLISQSFANHKYLIQIGYFNVT